MDPLSFPETAVRKPTTAKIRKRVNKYVVQFYGDRQFRQPLDRSTVDLITISIGTEVKIFGIKETITVEPGIGLSSLDVEEFVVPTTGQSILIIKGA